MMVDFSIYMFLFVFYGFDIRIIRDQSYHQNHIYAYISPFEQCSKPLLVDDCGVFKEECDAICIGDWYHPLWESLLNQYLPVLREGHQYVSEKIMRGFL
jgi:hypothetical protein